MQQFAAIFTCSWHRIALITALLASLSIIHLYFFPLFPSLESLPPSFPSTSSSDKAIRSPKSSHFSPQIDTRHEESNVSDIAVQDEKPIAPPSNSKFPTKDNGGSSKPSIAKDLYGGVRFRNAPWKADVGRWLSECFQESVSIPVVETIYNNSCPKDCSGQGICNRALRECRCFHGYGGSGCEEKLNLECNLETSPDQPYGPWVVSICSAYCDKTRAMCFCGNGFKYPERPVAEACGFVVNGTEVNWTKPDWDNIFTNDSEKFGWCNVDPNDGYDGKARYKEQCNCKYDCNSGQFCETPTQCVCINQCSGNGVCRGGFCQCNPGWYGMDCSMPSPSPSPLSWPSWLRPATVDIPDELPTMHSWEKQSIKATVKRKRPLIYVYDLPPEFNSHLLEGRHWKYECVNRVYDYANATAWTEQLYGAEIALYESLLASPHRTTNGDEADYFYVPVLGACLITRAHDSPHLSMQNYMYLRSYLTLDLYRRAFVYISEKHPYWNRTGGLDHIWFFSWDEGACYAPKEIWNSMMVVHWGNTNVKYNYSTTGYYPDNWDGIPAKDRGNHPCFDPQKDIVVPAWKIPDPNLVSSRWWERPRSARKNLFYFNGNLGMAYEHGRPEPNYSMGIRQKLAEEFGSSPNKEGKLGRQATSEVVVTQLRSENYAKELASSKFCGVLPGDGWSGRMEDSILHGCIPVIIQDGVQLLYENFLNYDSFAVRILEEDIPRLVQILRAVNEAELDFKLANVQSIWQRFLYRDSIMLEAHRQHNWIGRNDSWAQQFSTLTDDDVLSTFIQALHYKLYNDPWRVKFKAGQKQSGLPLQCQEL